MPWLNLEPDLVAELTGRGGNERGAPPVRRSLYFKGTSWSVEIIIDYVIRKYTISVTKLYCVQDAVNLYTTMAKTMLFS